VKIGSLFSGIGGLERGLELAGVGEVAWQVEADPFCRSVLEKHWPSVRRFSDVRDVYPWELEPVDVLCGGFPCQDISLAGKGAGLEGARSGLWANFAWLIGELRPRFVVIENVLALARRGLDRVLQDLADRGYDALWFDLQAADVGAPHKRARIFVVAWRVSDANGEQVRLEQQWRSDGWSRDVCDSEEPITRELGEAVANRDGGRLQAQWVAWSSGSGWQRLERGDEPDGCDLPKWPPAPDDLLAWGRVPAEAQPAFCKLAPGFSVGLDRLALKALGNAVVPDCAEVVGHVLMGIARMMG
jgi:DNA (cytosine-5)-methyltransferase 1